MDSREQQAAATAADSGAPATIGPFLGPTRVAYFTMEIALQPEVHTYSGGLGVLAGDTARACVDLDLPVVFVTLVSRKGYLRQRIDADGRQVEAEDPWSPEQYATPLRAKVAVILEHREVWVRPWLYLLKNAAGQRAPVLLLDTDLDENRADDRRLSDRLYGGDQVYRFKQEVVLGIGGLRVLQALGFKIQTYHMNEGHAAFLALDLLRRYPRPPDQVGEGELRWNVAPVREACVFTTHTPVEAGHDRFDYALYDRLLHDYFPVEQLRVLAGQSALNMTELALNLSGYVNGVAVMHAKVTTRMFPGYTIRAVTNGVHLPTWVHPALAELYNAMSPSWAVEPEQMVRFDQIDGEQLWAAHRRAKRDLGDVVRSHCGVELDPDVLTIGFARRMTAYKRPTLLFTDLERLRRIAKRQPLQLVIAGKSHPADENGKGLIHAVHQHLRELGPDLRAVYVPGYDMHVAAALVAGVDVWLNTPQPPLEASGTSGMKAAANGVLNLSVLDGWWLEGCIEGVTGWGLVAAGEDAAAELYETLEQQVLPAWQDRAAWIRMMQQTIGKIPCFFNTHRMMRRYATEAYLSRRSTVRPAAPPARS
jgi:starch phosphorylase